MSSKRSLMIGGNGFSLPGRSDLETAKDALAKLAELAETDRIEVAATDLSGTVIDLTLQAEDEQA
jgi:hypothetical protein